MNRRSNRRQRSNSWSVSSLVQLVSNKYVVSHPSLSPTSSLLFVSNIECPSDVFINVLVDIINPYIFLTLKIFRVLVISIRLQFQFPIVTCKFIICT